LYLHYAYYNFCRGYKHLNIDEQRPRIVNERKRIGDWESDTVVGQGRGSYFGAGRYVVLQVKIFL